MNGLQISQLNRAIVSGQKLGIFVLPKGPSGKVKLPPKTKPLTAKEVSSWGISQRSFLAYIIQQNTEPAAPVKKVASKPKVAVPKPVIKKAVPKKVSATATKKVTKKPASSSSRPGKKLVSVDWYSVVVSFVSSFLDSIGCSEGRQSKGQSSPQDKSEKGMLIENMNSEICLQCPPRRPCSTLVYWFHLSSILGSRS